jgi:hypothetical protein
MIRALADKYCASVRDADAALAAQVLAAAPDASFIRIVGMRDCEKFLRDDNGGRRVRRALNVVGDIAVHVWRRIAGQRNPSEQRNPSDVVRNVVLTGV